MSCFGTNWIELDIPYAMILYCYQMYSHVMYYVHIYMYNVKSNVEYTCISWQVCTLTELSYMYMY